MKNIIEVIKTNKGIIIKRGLIIVGAVAGLLIAATVLAKNGVEGENCESEETDDETDEDTDED